MGSLKTCRKVVEKVQARRQQQKLKQRQRPRPWQRSERQLLQLLAATVTVIAVLVTTQQKEPCQKSRSRFPRHDSLLLILTRAPHRIVARTVRLQQRKKRS